MYPNERPAQLRAKIGASDSAPTTPRDFDARRKQIWIAVKKELDPLGLWSSTFELQARLSVDTFDLPCQKKRDAQPFPLTHLRSIVIQHLFNQRIRPRRCDRCRHDIVHLQHV